MREAKLRIRRAGAAGATSLALIAAAVSVGCSGKIATSAQDDGEHKELQRVDSPTRMPKDRFASSIAVDGAIAVFGSPGTNAGGAAYVFVQNGSQWTQQQLIVPSDLAFDDGYGSSVALSGTTIVVGASGSVSAGGSSTLPTGAAYVFSQSGTVWTQEGKLTPSSPSEHVSFGASVAIHGSTVIVGSYRYPSAGNGTAAACVFTPTEGASNETWKQDQELVAGNEPVYITNSVNVAFDGATILLGSQPFQGSAGEVDVYAKSGATWALQQKLTSSDSTINDLFGVSVTVDGDTAVVAANLNAVDYVFARTGAVWKQQARIVVDPTPPGGDISMTVALSGNTLIAGEGNAEAPLGAAYVYTGDGSTWTRQASLNPDDVDGPVYFGSTVAIGGSTIMIGSNVTFGGDIDESGAVFIFN